MANSAWSETILQLLRRMNNFYLPASGRSKCLRFEINGVQVGWIPPHVAPLLTRYPEVFSPPLGGAVSLRRSLDSYEKRSEAVDAVLRTMRREGAFTCLKGWRDEKNSVMPAFSDPPLMWMERAATSLFGVKRYGVHINGYTVGDGGEVRMWLARRSLTKQTYPGLLDNVVSARRDGPETPEISDEKCGGWHRRRRWHQTHVGQGVRGGSVYPSSHCSEGSPRSQCELHLQGRGRGVSREPVRLRSGTSSGVRAPRRRRRGPRLPPAARRRG
ncbi:uncharacterized protein LOC130199181 isoform X3 [Pseudoliparis swirei]|nr:uncharacterized protein LOC130199181 isoform X3 [Pseudoliparis swirei]